MRLFYAALAIPFVAQTALAASGNVSRPETAETSSEFQRAEDARHDGRFDDALAITAACISAADNLLILSEEDVDAHWRRLSCSLAQGRALHDLSRFDEADDVLKRVETDARTWAQEQSDTRYEQLVSTALIDRGDIARDREDWERALNFYKAASVLDYRLREDDPDDFERRLNLANSEARIGDTFLSLGRLDKAREHYRKSADVLRGMAGRYPRWREPHSRLVKVLNDLADLERDEGAFAAAEATYMEALGAVRRLVLLEPHDLSYRWSLANVLDDYGDLLHRVGRNQGALASFEEAAAGFDAYFEFDPEDGGALLRAAFAYGSAANAVLALGDHASAMAHYETAAARFQDLMARAPDNLITRRDAAVNYYELANAALDAGELKRAAKAAAADLRLSEALLADDPNGRNRQSDVAYSHMQIGRVIAADGDLAAAIASFGRALVIRRALAEASPFDADEVIDLSEDLRSAYQFVSDAGHSGLARLYLREADARMSSAIEKAPDHQGAFLELSTVLALLGEHHQSLDDSPAAHVALEQALLIDKEAYGKWPDDRDSLRYLAISHGAAAAVREAVSKNAWARAGYAEAARLWRRFGERYPDAAATSLSQESWALRALGLSHEGEDDLETALAIYRKAVTRSLEMAAANPDDPFVLEAHAHNQRFLSLTIADVEKGDAVRTALQTSIATSDKALVHNPDSDDLFWGRTVALWRLAELAEGDEVHWRTLYDSLVALKAKGPLASHFQEALTAASEALGE